MIRLLIGPRQYSKRDSKYLQTFVLVILYVVRYISDLARQDNILSLVFWI